MEIEIYFSHSFVNVNSDIYKITDDKDFDQKSKTSAKKMYSKGWKLAHAIKTSQSAQLEDFNFLLIFEK